MALKLPDRIGYHGASEVVMPHTRLPGLRSILTAGPLQAVRGVALAGVVCGAGCGKSESDDSSEADGASASTDECGDVDGAGGDTGDVPNILGAWTASFSTLVYDDGGCSVSGLEAADMRAWMDGVMTIDGRVPDRLFATFSNSPDDRFFGLENTQGGVVFTGNKTFGGHELYVSVGGLLYTQPQLDRDEIRGFGYIGVDLDGADGGIDCWLQGDFRAIRSGS